MSRGSKPVKEGAKSGPKPKKVTRPSESRGPGRGRAGAASTRGSGRTAKASTRSSAPGARSAAGGARTDRAGGAARSADRPDRPERTTRPPRRATERGLGGDQVEGRHAVRELLLAGRRKVHEVWLAVDPDEDAVVADDLAELAQAVGVPVREVSRSKLYATARTEAPQGVLAKARDLPEEDFDELLTTEPGSPSPFLLAVDGVTDPGNLGALLRTAECAGVTGVVLPRHRAVHITPTVTKAAAGAVEYLPMTVVGGLPTAITKAQKAGVWVVGLDGGAPVGLFDLALDDQPVMLVLGAEGKGLSRLVRQRCDVVAAIPLGGQLSSLNVAAAGALACFEVARHRLVPAGRRT